MMNEELDSQLSAMFDGELPEEQCELLARRLARDENLKARWGRYATISAAIRKEEQGIQLRTHLASRVSAAIAAEPPLVAKPVGRRKAFGSPAVRRWAQPIIGAALAASVAAVAIFALRAQAPLSPVGGAATPFVAQTSGVSSQEGLVARSTFASTEPDSYTVPQTIEPPSFVPSAELANYVVAHSEFSSPLSRRNLLSALVASEQGTTGESDQSEEPVADGTHDAEQAQ